LGDGDDRSRLEFSLGERQAPLGQPLRIELPAGALPEELRIRVSYRTSPEASGLQWLDPAQTADKTHPFLFTQSQAIHARRWIPLQDTPQVRTTYSASSRTPAALRAVMSADHLSGEGEPGPRGMKLHRF